MAKMNAVQFREKQARNLKNATPDIIRGIDAVTEAPGKKAAEKEDKLKQNWLRSIDNGKWARNVSAVTLEEWKKAAKEKGVNRIAAGIDGAAGKVEAFAEQLLPELDRISAKVQSMPDTTLEDNINRMVFQVREMSKFEFKRN